MTKLEELLVNKGLYDSIEISIDDVDELEKLFLLGKYNVYTIDCFCPECGEKRIFESVDKKIQEETGFVTCNVFDYGSHDIVPSNAQKLSNLTNKRYSLSFRCTRDHNHSLLFDLLFINDKIIKIGQYPSFADISANKTKKYKNILKEKYKEYNTSLGLFSHGVGIGSFVYLRRIIESLVFETYDNVKEKLDISDKEFKNQRFQEKLETLHEYLPNILVENKNLYGIISKGIHELSEKECLKYYPSINAGIELILDDIISKYEQEEKKKLFAKFVGDTTGELNNK